MKSNNKSSSHHSRAGKLGCAARWKDHIKQPTKIVRVYNEDFDYFADYCRGSDVSFIMALHFLVTFIRERHGYSAFMCGRQICKSFSS